MEAEQQQVWELAEDGNSQCSEQWMGPQTFCKNGDLEAPLVRAYWSLTVEGPGWGTRGWPQSPQSSWCCGMCIYGLF